VTDPGTRALAAAVLREVVSGELPEAARLRVLDGPLAGQLLPVGPEETLGRGAGASLRLPDPAASRLHARLVAGSEGLSIEDLGSRNGLRVNGRLRRGGTRLRPGDLVTLGATRLLVDRVAPRPPGPPPPRRPDRSRLLAAALLLVAAGTLLAAAAP
jgi:hypothetical protein